MDDKKKTKAQLIAELEELRKQNKQLRNLVENSKDMLYRMSLPDGKYEYVSSASSDIFGYSPEEFYTSPLLIKEIMRPDCHAYFEKQQSLLLAGNIPPSYEYQILRKSGDTRWINQRNVLVCDKSGNPIAIEGIITDITERKRAEEENINKDRFLSSIIEQSPYAIWISDAEGTLQSVNPALKRFLNLTDEQLVGKYNVLKDPLVVRQGLIPLIRTVYEKGKVINFTCDWNGNDIPTLNLKGSNPVSIEAIMFPIHNPEGKLTNVVLIWIDITERKRAEEALRNSEARFRDLVEMLPEAVFETDRNLELTFANRRAFELFGYSEEDLARGMNSLEMLAPEERDRAKANTAMRLRGEDPRTVEYQALKKDGSVFPVLFHASSIMKEGELFGLRGVIVDITERRRAEEEKAKLEEHYRQAQKVESLGRLAGGVAHDLNNMLTPIIGYAEILMDDFGTDDERREFVDGIMRSGLRARDLVRQLLAFGRKQFLEYKTLDMNEIIKGFHKLLLSTIREDIEIKIIPSPNIQTVRADVGQIEQVIMNLAVNAQDAMPEGGKLTLETAMVTLDESYTAAHQGTKPGEYVMLAVSDTGCGMDKEIREQIFEPFFSTKGMLGTGMGLATVYGIIKQHEGNIWVYSEPGKGTTFKIYLPAYEKEHVGKSVPEESGGNLRGSETILLAEDDENVRYLSQTFLLRQGYTVLVAENGAKALTVMESHDGPVHLLLTDVVMPGMNGSDLYAQAAEKQPGLKVLYMSGYTDDILSHRGILGEGYQFIQKPFSSQALAAKVREVLNT